MIRIAFLLALLFPLYLVPVEIAKSYATESNPNAGLGMGLAIATIGVILFSIAFVELTYPTKV